MQNFDSILDLFSVLGSTHLGFFSNKFKFYLAFGWQTPSFSPVVLLPNNELNEADLISIESYFKENVNKNPALKNQLYFNFFKGQNLYDVESIKSICHKYSWEIDPDPLSINLLQDLPFLKPLSDISIFSYDTVKRGVIKDYADLIKDNFNANDEYIDFVENLYRHANANSYTVLLHNKHGQTIAGGTVSIKNEISFLTWGSVNKEYRMQGMHDILLSACNMIAKKNNAAICGFTTRNKHIRNKCGIAVEMYICRKIMNY